MVINKKAAMKALNILASIGIIATLFLGFFLALSQSQLKEVKKVQANLDHLESSNQLLTILRTPVGKLTVADQLAKGDTMQFVNNLKLVFGDDIKYKVVIDNTILPSQHPRNVIAKLNTTLPLHPSGLKSFLVEVGK